MPNVNIILMRKKSVLEKDAIINLKEVIKYSLIKNTSALDSDSLFIEEIKFYMNYIKENQNLI